MTEPAALGLDLNGLLDAVASGWPATVTEGAIPSVLIPLERRRGSIDVIAGAEASNAIEGRGWAWPEAARAPALGGGRRIPVADVLRRLQGDNLARDRDEPAPSEFIAAAVDALAGPATLRRGVLAVPDHAGFDEDVRQAMLDSFARRRWEVTLLWRSVAAFLGTEPALRRYADRLSGKRVGLISVTADGIEAAALALETETAPDGTRYLVPVRHRAGIRVDLTPSVFDRAIALARAWLPDHDTAEAEQLVWGNGHAIRRLLGLKNGRTIVQTRGRWAVIDGEAPISVDLPDISEASAAALNAALDGCELVLLEGPGLFARDCDGEQFAYRLKERLALRRYYLEPPGAFHVARGCATFAWRKTNGWRSYSDFLPQLRITARVDGEARFLPLIPAEARVEGGEEYVHRIDLGFMLRKAATSFNVFMVKGDENQVRSAAVELMSPPESDVRIGIEIVQRPAQGRARLTFVPGAAGANFTPVELDWRSMSPDGRDENAILAELNSSAAAVPPSVSVRAHSLLWISPIGGVSLVQLLEGVPSAKLSRELRKRLSRRDSPWRITRGGNLDRALYRAVATDGSVPDDLDLRYADLLDHCLGALARTSGVERDSAIITCAWAFTRCPRVVVEELRARLASGTPSNHDINAAGRVFAADAQFRALFHHFDSVSRFLEYHAAALFSVLSLRERAARALTSAQASTFAERALQLLHTELNASNFSRRCRASIKLIAALLRYRLAAPDFLKPGASVLAGQIENALRETQRRSPDPNVAALAKSALDYLQDHGSDVTILEHDPD